MTEKSESDRMLAAYQRATRVGGFELLRKLVFGHTVSPNWLEDGDRFWFVRTRPGSVRFLVADPHKKVVATAFDHDRLASVLSKTVGEEIDGEALPIQKIEPRGSMVLVDTAHGRWKLDLDTYDLERVSGTPIAARGELISPDGKRAAFLRDHNLWVRLIEGGDEIQLTEDGDPDNAYATLPDFGGETNALTIPVTAVWSPDSSKLFTHRLDQRTVEPLFLMQSVTPQGRPAIRKLRYPMAGDERVPLITFLVVDIDSRKVTSVKSEPHPASYQLSPIMFGRAWWSPDGSSVFLLTSDRGDKTLTLTKIAVSNAETRTLVQEDSETFVTDAPTHQQRPNVHVTADSSEVVWWSERDGWGHLYLYNGHKQKQITQGNWVVREIVYVDEGERRIYFSASGREDGDPYLRRFYVISFDGRDLTLLDDEKADHEIVSSPSGRFFLDTYSTVETPPKTVLRNRTGTAILEVEATDTGLLERDGWRWPQRFSVRAADGVTNLWGNVYRPSNFDPKNRYPVLVDVYPGLQLTRAPSGWSSSRGGGLFDKAPSMAELGFVVICLNPRGGPFRDRAFRDVGYARVDDPWLDDHVAALRQLGDRHPWLDLNRVGIYGHSLGGWASARAILKYPIFKVAVSTAGAHDSRSGWYAIVERQQGLDLDSYSSQSNIPLASNLRGKLLLIHGDSDSNVGLHMTLQLVDALVKANRDFDLLVVPNASHGFLGSLGYITKRQWDYFVRHLLGKEPPAEFVVPEPRLDFATRMVPPTGLKGRKASVGES